MNSYHDKPVNRQAAMLLRKAPWWAKCPEAVEKAVPTLVKSINVRDLVDLTAPPPTDRKDRRGPNKLKRGKERGGKVFVTGWSHREVKKRIRQPSTNHKPSWWVGDDWDPSRKNISGYSMEYWWGIYKGEVVIAVRDGKRNEWYLPNTKDQSSPSD